ncbi:integrase core domain-containing protein [Rhizobium sp. 32-5/1]|uniref:integrase core domain-containing protein n=1 Tax=Rhizobium sp. 32-5/1 TaxID=3019602 RepID=UPI00240D819D|nr:integrase core domain-containing protein [Rhizobium sp. 32-5/1]WEZ85087.1 integrase core domain-containing protein [Rhizobium sp. 32-5/1]
MVAGKRTKRDYTSGKISEAMIAEGLFAGTLLLAKVAKCQWLRGHYNTVRPHSSLNYKSPAPEAAVWPRQNGPTSTPAVAARPSMH